MLPIAYDRQQASAIPENPDVVKMLTISAGLGSVETVLSLVFAYGADPSGLFQGDYTVTDCDTQAQAGIWLQMFIAAELLIFVTRSPSFMLLSLPPSIALFISVIIGCFVTSMMAGLSQTFGGLQIADIVLIWAYDILGLIILDTLKVALLKYFNENTEVLPEPVETGSVSDKPAKGHHKDHEVGTEVDGITHEDDFSRASMSANRLTDWALANNDGRMSTVGERPSVAAKKRVSSANMVSHEHNKIVRESLNGRYSLSHGVGAAGGSDLRPSFVGGSIRPNIPANRSKF